MTTPRKIDLFKLNKDEYAAPKKPVLIQVRPAKYLAITGQGAPGGDEFSACIGALYAVAYTIKMTRKFAGEQDYAVCKLEGQWYFDRDPADIPKEEWRWKVLIRTPEFITRKDLETACAAIEKKGGRTKAKPGAPPASAKRVSLKTLNEGACVQMLHVGPYDRVGETIQVMSEFAQSKGCDITGPHHEIYLSDPHRVPPDRLKTILREPVRKLPG